MGYVIIFGASGGIGKEVSKILARNGHSLILSGTRLSILEELKDTLSREHNIDCSVFPLNFIEIEKQKHQLNQYVKNLKISGSIFVQGIMEEQDIYFQNQDKILELYQINFFGVVSVISLFIKEKILETDGFVSVFSSVAGLRGRKKNFVYGSSKAALNCYLEGLRHQYTRMGMFIQTVIPGMVETKMTQNMGPSRLMAKPEKIAEDFYKGLKSKKQIVYTPGYWKIIMMVVKNIPNFIFSRLNF